MRKKFVVILIFMLLIIYLIFKLGIYQNDSIKVNNIIFSKPHLYRMQSYSFKNEKYTSFKISDFISLNNDFKVKDTLMLVFNKFYSREKITLLFSYSKKEEENFSLLSGTNEIIYYKNCNYIETKRFKDDQEIFEIYGIIKNNNINFLLVSNNKDNLKNLKNEICK